MHFSKLKMLGKGLGAALLAQIILQLQGADMAEVLADPQAWGVTVGVGLLRALLNAVKNRHMRGNPLGRRPTYPNVYRAVLCLLLPALLVGGGLAGCKTTTHADGTVVQAVDLALLLEAYEFYRMEAARLEAEEARADAAEEAERRAALEQARRVLEQLRARLAARGYEFSAVPLE